MKNLFPWLRRCQFPLMMLLSVMPVLLIALCMNAPQALPAAYWLFGAYVALSSLCLLIPGRYRMPLSALGSAGLLALSAFLFPIKAQPLLLLLPAALIGLLFFSLPLALRQYESDISPYIYFVGVGIHIVTQFLHRYFDAYDGASPYAPVETAMTASLIGYMVLFLLSMNRISLDNASLSRHRIPAGMRTINTVMTLSFLAGSLLLSVTPAIVRGVTSLWHAFTFSVRKLFALLLSLLPSADSAGLGAQGGADGMLPLGEGINEPSAFAVLLQKIATVVTAILLAAGTLYLLYVLIRALIRFTRRLALRLRAYVSAASGEYEDEVTDTREDGAQREILFLRRNRRAAQEAEKTPAGRIRQTYARLLRKKPQWPSSSTARENLPENAAALYERARYSEHPISSEDADCFAREIRNEKKG